MSTATDCAGASASSAADPEMNNIAAAEGAQGKAAAAPQVRLLSRDGEAFDVEWAAAVQSATIRMLLEASPLLHEHHTKTLPFPSIEAKVLRKVVDYMRWKLEAAASAADDVQEFRVEPEIALDMMLAADYLDL